MTIGKPYRPMWFSMRQPTEKQEGFAMVRILVMTGALLTLAGCNTIEGVGEDIQRGGQAIQRAVN